MFGITNLQLTCPNHEALMPLGAALSSPQTASLLGLRRRLAARPSSGGW